MTTAADWVGRVGEVWAEEWRRTDRSFAGLAPSLNAAILAAAPERGRAVDLGCGAGTTSIALARARPGLLITGIDISSQLVRVATERTADFPPSLQFMPGDLASNAARHAAGAHLLFSRHGVMFFDNPASVFVDLRQAAAPGARLVFSCFRKPALNPWATDLVEAVTGSPTPPPAGYAPGPFGFADAEWTNAMLVQAGWTEVKRESVDYRYLAGEGSDPVGEATALFRRIGPVARALADAPPDHRPAMLDRLTGALADHHYVDQVTFPAAAWIWSARA